MKAFTGGLALALCVALASFGVRGAEQFLLLRLDGHHLKWGAPALGTGATVRYAFAAAPMHFPDARNCREIGPLDLLLQASEISPAELRREIAAAFALWEAVADIRFLATDDPGSADILIGAQLQPRGRAFADVAYERAGPAIGRIHRSLICLNPAESWKVGFGGNREAYDLRYVIAHEAGHAIGLNHPGPSGQLMSFKYSEAFRTLQPGDISGAVALYGQLGTRTAAPPPGSKNGRGSELGLR